MNNLKTIFGIAGFIGFALIAFLAGCMPGNRVPTDNEWSDCQKESDRMNQKIQNVRLVKE